MYETRQDFFESFSHPRNKVFHSEVNSRIFSRIRQIRCFEGVRFLPNSPTQTPRGSVLTPMIQLHKENLEFR
jgi:hypothetical protein